MNTPNPFTVQDLGNFLSGQNGSVNPLDMTQGGANLGLSQFFNSPGFQIQNGTGPSNQLSLFGQYNPSLAFESDPGVQLAVQQGMNPLMNQMSSNGLGQSGALAQALSQYMYNNYNQYTNQQETGFNNYQNQLMGLSNLGSQNSGAANAMTAGQNQANLIGQGNLATGQTTSGNITGAGNNISGLFANQGVLNASGYLNTGAAQANNLFNGMSFLAQIEAANNASQNGQQASLAGGAGKLQGVQSSMGRTGGLF